MTMPMIDQPYVLYCLSMVVVKRALQHNGTYWAIPPAAVSPAPQCAMACGEEECHALPRRAYEACVRLVRQPASIGDSSAQPAALALALCLCGHKLWP